MGFWSSLGSLAKQFAEYALAQKLAAAVPLPQVPVAPTPQPVPAPAPTPPLVVEAPPLTLAQKWEDKVQDIAVEILGYVLTDQTELRGYEKLMDAGREDEARKNLRGKL